MAGAAPDSIYPPDPQGWEENEDDDDDAEVDVKGEGVYPSSQVGERGWLAKADAESTNESVSPSSTNLNWIRYSCFCCLGSKITYSSSTK
tara:strand:- start:114 stop:383 length:270 start_codon:yes stop_codon:yes gene_type:complete